MYIDFSRSSISSTMSEICIGELDFGVHICSEIRYICLAVASLDYIPDND